MPADLAYQVCQVSRVGVKQAFFGGVHEGFGTHFLSENLLKACLKTHAFLIGRLGSELSPEGVFPVKNGLFQRGRGAFPRGKSHFPRGKGGGIGSFPLS